MNPDYDVHQRVRDQHKNHQEMHQEHGNVADRSGCVRCAWPCAGGHLAPHPASQSGRLRRVALPEIGIVMF